MEELHTARICTRAEHGSEARRVPMDLTRRGEKLVTKRVFRRDSSVCDVDMSAAALQLADQVQCENARVAEGLKRHDPQLLDELILQYQHRLLRYLLYLTGRS